MRWAKHILSLNERAPMTMKRQLKPMPNGADEVSKQVKAQSSGLVSTAWSPPPPPRTGTGLPNLSHMLAVTGQIWWTRELRTAFLRSFRPPPSDGLGLDCPILLTCWRPTGQNDGRRQFMSSHTNTWNSLGYLGQRQQPQLTALKLHSFF